MQVRSKWVCNWGPRSVDSSPCGITLRREPPSRALPAGSEGWEKPRACRGPRPGPRLRVGLTGSASMAQPLLGVCITGARLEVRPAPACGRRSCAHTRKTGAWPAEAADRSPCRSSTGIRRPRWRGVSAAAAVTVRVTPLTPRRAAAPGSSPRCPPRRRLRPTAGAASAALRAARPRTPGRRSASAA